MKNSTIKEVIPDGMLTRMTFVIVAIVIAGCISQAAAQDKQTAPAPERQAPGKANGATRTEKDLLGEKQVPADAYYGVQTARALENFQISGMPINHYPEFVEAWAIVKLAAARANTDAGAMTKESWPRSRRRRRPCSTASTTISSGGLVPGRRRHVDQHERQRGAGQHRPRADRPQEGRIQVPRAARRPEHVAVDERLLSDGDQGRVHPAQRQADRGAAAAGRRRSAPRATSTWRS